MLADPMQTGERGLAARLHDGYELHRAALRHGFQVALYPRQVLMLTRPAQPQAELAFVHGIPLATSLAAVTYAQDKRMRRELLQRAGLSVPEGATFAIGRDLEQARLFAREVGYPVVVKPAVGENLEEVFAGVRDERQLDAAIDYLRTPELERPTFTRAAYALTLLLEPDEEDGRAVAPASYQFLIERQVPGEYLHLVVSDQQVLAAVLRNGAGGAPHDVTSALHPSLAELAVRAARAIPGLAVAAVGMVVADHQLPAERQQPCIVDFSERPQLSVPAAAAPELGHQLGEAILLRSAAAEAVLPGEPQDEVTVGVQIEGCTDPAGVAAAFGKAADEYRVGGEVSVADRVEGTAAGHLTGPPGELALIFELLLAGQLYDQRAMLVDLRHS